MSLITQNDREYILGQLRTAPDSILAEAMLKLNAMREDFIAVRNLCKSQETAGKPVSELEPAPEPVVEAVTRKNVSPGAPTTSKVGLATEGHIVLELGAGRQPGAKYADALKLLWSRGKVKFDGQEYYL